MNVGEQIKKVRKTRKLTQKQLADSLGIAEITVRQYEADKRAPSLEQLPKIATALGVEWHELMGVPKAKPVSPFDPDYIQPPHGIYDIEEEALKQGIIDDFKRLNPTGKREAAIRVNELTEIPRYQKDDKNGNDKKT